MSELRQAGQHPDADQLNAFVEDALPAHEREQTLAHLAGCPRCRQIVALSLPLVEELPMVAAAAAAPPTEPVRRFPALRLVWVAVPAVAALIAVGIFMRRPEAPTHTPTTAPQVADVRPPAPEPAPEAATKAEPPASAPPVAARPSSPRPAKQNQEPMVANRLEGVPPAGAPSGVMGGILGGIGTSPTPQVAPVAGALAAPPINGRNAGATSFFPVANLLPSNAAILSMASHVNQRVAIDANHQLFFSDDNGRQWKAITAPWKGHAVRVSVVSGGVAMRAGLPLARKAQPTPQALISRPAALAATNTSAPLSGTIKDPTGASIEGAKVEAIEFGSVVSSAASDSEGKFHLENLPPGSYRVQAEAPGFEKQSSVTQISPAQPATVDFTLRVTAMAQTVNVQSASPALDTVIISPVAPALAQFELTTDDGQTWVSDDGQTWKPKQ